MQITISALRYFTLIISLFSSISYADIYTWTDANGIVHFSDIDHQGSTKIDLPNAQNFQTNTTTAPSAPATPAKINQDEEYTQCQITTPQNEETIRSSEGVLPVIVQVTPELKAKDRLQVLFDGAPIGTPQSSTMFTLRGINRGKHTVTAQIIDSDDNVLNTSDTITVFMQNPRINMVPRNKIAPSQ